jgi:hypothetical protein
VERPSMLQKEIGQPLPQQSIIIIIIIIVNPSTNDLYLLIFTKLIT